MQAIYANDGITVIGWSYTCTWNAYTFTFEFDTAYNSTGYRYTDGTTETSCDKDGNVLSTQVLASGLTPVYAADGVTVTGYTQTDASGTTSNYDTMPTLIGYSTITTNGDGSSTTYNYDTNWNYTGSVTKDASGNVLYSDSFGTGLDANGNTVPTYTYFDGTTTTVYNANDWSILSSSVNTANLTPVLDANGNTIGYTHTDQWGSTTTYDLNGSVTGHEYSYTNWDGSVTTSNYDANWNYTGSVTADANGNVLYSNAYLYDANGTFTGYTYFDGTTTWTYDANWNLTGTSVNTANLTPVLDANGNTIGYTHTDQWGTTTTYDLSGSVTGYEYSYTNWDGSTSVYSYSANWSYVGSVTKDANGNVLYSDSYLYDANGNYTGYTYFDGTTTWTYDASWNLVGSTVNTANMTPILDANGATIGYSYTDQWGTTTTYDLNGLKTGSSSSWTNWDGSVTVYNYDARGYYLGSTTTDANGHVLYSDSYTYDANGNFMGYAYFDGTTTWTYDANWILTGSTVNTASMTPILDANGATIGYSHTDQWGTTTTYDLGGNKTGSSYTWTNWDGSASVSNYDANGYYTGSVTTSANGTVLYSDTYLYDANGFFAGYTYFDGTTTWTYDANWNLVSSSVSTANMTPILDANGATIGYSHTDQWGTTTNYDLSGNKTGSSYSYTNWDGSVSVTTYDANGNYIGSVTTDANGNVLYSNTYFYDAFGNYTGYTYFDGTTTWTYDANWNLVSSTVNTANMTPILDANGATIGYSTTDQWGTTTTYDLNGNKTGSSYTWTNWDGSTSVSSYDANGYYTGSVTTSANGTVLYSDTWTYDANGFFTGYTYFDGTTTTVYDANWNVVSSTVNTASMTPILDANGATIGYSHTDQWGTTTSYDLNGNKTGSSSSYTNWDGSVSVSNYDANGNYIGSETKDANGHVLYSNTYLYDAFGNFTGYIYFDGTTTWTYDANWNLTGSSVDVTRMTPILDANGATIGYSDTDQWGTTTTYDLNGNKTGSSYTWTNWDGSTTVSSYDASGLYIGSVTTSANGTVLYSDTYTYDANGFFTGYTYFNGTTTTVYDANWNVVSSTVNTASMTPILDANGATIGYSYTDQWGTTTTYDLNGNKTGSSNTWLDTWSGNTTVSTYDANGYYTGSVTTDANGHVLYSNTYTYDANGNYTGYTYFDGTTTTVYDANGNVVSSSVDISTLTPVYAADGVTVVSYTSVDPYNSNNLTTYDLNGNVTGHISHWISNMVNPSTGNYDTGVTTFDANWNMLTNSWSDGVITTTTDGNGNFISAQADNLALLTPDGNGGYTYVYSGGIDIVNFDSTGMVTQHVGSISYNGTSITVVQGPDWNSLISLSLSDASGITYFLDGVNSTDSWSLAANSIFGALSGTDTGNGGGVVTGTVSGDTLGLFSNLTVTASQVGSTANGGTMTMAIDRVGASGSYLDTWFQMGQGGSFGFCEYNAATGDYYAQWVDISNNGNIVTGSSVSGNSAAPVDAVALLHHPDMTALAASQTVPFTDVIGQQVGYVSTALDANNNATVYAMDGVTVIGHVNYFTDTVTGNVSGTFYDATGAWLGYQNRDANGNLIDGGNNIYDANGNYVGYAFYFGGVATLYSSSGSYTAMGSITFDGTTVTVFDTLGTVMNSWMVMPAGTGGTPPGGTTPGATSAVYLAGHDLVSDGLMLNFSDIVHLPATPAITLSLNGITAMNVLSVGGDGTSSLTLHTDQMVTAGTDWVLVNYAGTNATNALSDAAGNLVIPNNPAGHGGGAMGSSSNDTIDLSSAVFTAASYDLLGGAGDDWLVGSAGTNNFMGGVGADHMTGGAGANYYGFTQGDSTAATFSDMNANGLVDTGDIYLFALGSDAITNFHTGDAIILSDQAINNPATSTGVTFASGTGGILADQTFYAVQGWIDPSGGGFTVDTTLGTDTLVVYDGDPTAGVTQTALVLSGVTTSQLQMMAGSNVIAHI